MPHRHGHRNVVVAPIVMVIAFTFLFNMPLSVCDLAVFMGFLIHELMHRRLPGGWVT
jgi:hypothetical protein